VNGLKGMCMMVWESTDSSTVCTCPDARYGCTVDVEPWSSSVCPQEPLQEPDEPLIASLETLEALRELSMAPPRTHAEIEAWALQLTLDTAYVND